MLLSLLTLAVTLSAQPGVTVERDITYGRVGTKELKLDIYRPEKAAGLLPVVIWIHGGAFRSGDKDGAKQVSWLAADGYALVSINYRLSQEAIWPAQIDDCKAAVRWVRSKSAELGFDAARVGVWGPSAGGHLVAMLGTSSRADDAASRVDAVVDFYGPTDFVQMDRAALAGGMKHDPADSPESQLVGGAIQENKDKVAKANPITYVTRDAPPFLILHGEQDPLVPVNQSELLFQALTAAKVPVTFHKIAGAGHGGPQFDTPWVRAMVRAFFDQHLARRAKPVRGN